MDSGPPRIVVETPVKGKTVKGAGWALFLMATIWTLNYMDRNIISALAQPMKESLHITDTQLGFLQGLAFVLLFTIATLPLARLADKHNRVTVISLGLAAWSVITSATAFVTGFWQLLATRTLVGIGEASSAGPIQALLTDYFPVHKRSRVMSLLVMCTFMGVLLAFMTATTINHIYGWRMAFLVLGVPGLLVAVLFKLTVKELPRGGTEVGEIDSNTYSLGQTLGFLFSQPSYVLIVIAFCMSAITSSTIISWVGPMLQRLHHLSNQQVGLIAGPVMGLSGIVGALLGAAVMTKLSERDVRWIIRAPVYCMILTAPAMAVMCLSPQLPLAFAGLVVATIASGLQTGPLIASIFSISKVRMRSVAGGLVVAISNIFGWGAGPLLVGMISDKLAPQYGPESLRYAMLLGAVTIIIGALLLSFCIGRLKQDMARASRI